MFKGESFATFKTSKPMPDVLAVVKDMLERLGRVQINNRGSITVSPKDKFQTFLVDTTIEGELKKSQTQSEYTLTVNYSCAPSVMNWVIAVAGTLFCLFGFIVLIAPIMTKGTLAKEVQRALGEVEDSFGSSQPLLQG